MRWPRNKLLVAIIGAALAAGLLFLIARLKAPRPNPELVTPSLAFEALEGRSRFGTRVFAVSTSDEHTDHARLAEFGWWTASVFALDGYGWGMPAFSAVTSRLPWLPRPGDEASLARADRIGDVTLRDGRWQRTTTIGTIVVDTTTHRGALEKR